MAIKNRTRWRDLADEPVNPRKQWATARLLFRSIMEEFDTITGPSGVLSVAASVAHQLLSSTHSDTIAGSASAGDLIFGNTTAQWDRLSIGASSRFLTSSGTAPQWSPVAVGYPTFGIALTGQAFSP